MNTSDGKRTCVDCEQSYLLPRMRYRRGEWRCDECSDRDRFHGASQTQHTARSRNEPDPYANSRWTPLTAPPDYPPEYVGRTWPQLTNDGYIQSTHPPRGPGEQDEDDFYTFRAYHNETGRQRRPDDYCAKCHLWLVSRTGMTCGHCLKRAEEAQGIFHRRKDEGEKAKPKPKKAPTKRRESLRTNIPGVR